MDTDLEDFVKCPANMFAVSKKLNERNGSVCFWNCTKEFKIVLRFSEIDDDMELECCVLSDDDSDVQSILEMESGGYWDDEDYVVKTIHMPLEYDEPKVLGAMRELNDMYNTRICHCNERLVHPPDTICLACELRMPASRVGGPDGDQCCCCICHDPVLDMHAVTQPCCQQRFHKKCLQTWHRVKRQSGADAPCPMCRTVT